MTVATSLVDWHLLGQAVLTSVVFGLAVLLVAGVAVACSLRAENERGRGHEAVSIGLSLVATCCVLGIVAAIAGGIWVMAQ